MAKLTNVVSLVYSLTLRLCLKVFAMPKLIFVDRSFSPIDFSVKL